MPTVLELSGRAVEPPGNGVFRIALICTGNRFRSPLAEGFLRKHGMGLPLDLQSFGTIDIGPLPPLPEALQAARRHGLELHEHRACSLTSVRLTGADLVLGFERLHLATAVVDAGAPKARAFTLPEIVDLLNRLPAEGGPPSAGRARERVGKAHRLRAGSKEQARFPEIADPFGGPAKGYSELAVRLEQLCRGTLQGLFGRTADGSGSRSSAQIRRSAGGR